MHTFTSARRPKIVYGRIRGMQQQQRRRARAESNASSGSDGRLDGAEASDSDDQNDDAKLAKENGTPSVAALSKVTILTKQKNSVNSAAPKRKPLRQKHNGTTSSDDVAAIETDDSAAEAIRSSVQRRKARGTETRPIVISSSSSSLSLSSASSPSSYASAKEDAGEAHQQQSEANVEQLGKQLESMLQVTHSTQSLNPLLTACDQTHVLQFDTCLDDIERQADSSQWKKIGEATYSEVYSMQGSGMVLKVIPLLEADEQGPAGDESDDTTAIQLERSSPGDVMREVYMTRSLSTTDDTFVKLHRAAIVRGAYPARLLRAWDARPRIEADQNVRPDAFEDRQLYGLLLLSDGGQDLETFPLTTWSQAASLFCQVTSALAHAERSCQYEHRDLHWGNIVVQYVEAARRRRRRAKSASGSALLDLQQISSTRWSGVQATIIDFTLSRACLTNTDGSEAVTAHPFDDDEFFSGSGDVQFDVYRQMRTCTQGDWRGFHPRTNVLWLRYLLIKIIDDKQLLAPASSSTDEAEMTCFTLLSSTRDALEMDVIKDDGDDEGRANIIDAGALAKLLTSLLSEVNAKQLAE